MTDLAEFVAHAAQLPFRVGLQQKLVVADEGTCGATGPSEPPRQEGTAVEPEGL